MNIRESKLKDHEDIEVYICHSNGGSVLICTTRNWARVRIIRKALTDVFGKLGLHWLEVTAKEKCYNQ